MGVYGTHINEYASMTVVNEAYIGKTPLLIKMEDQIGIIRDNLGKYRDNGSAPEVLELNRMFEKQFGMRLFSLHIIPSEMVNAFTQVIAVNFDIADDVDLENWVVADMQKGFRFRDGNEFCIMASIYTGLLGDPNYTNEEILAVLLHELGHNFADCVYKTIRVANQNMMKGYRDYLRKTAVLRAILTLGLSIIKDATEKNKFNSKKRLARETRRQGKMNKFRGLLDGIINHFKDREYFKREVNARLSGGVGWKAAKARVNVDTYRMTMRSSVGRQNEVLADKFAGIYGYGPAQASALLKMHHVPSKASNYVDSLGAAQKRANDAYTDNTKDLHNFDVHPQVIQRIYSELHLYEEEVKRSDVDPRMKKVIQDQIRQMKAMIKEYSITSEEYDSKDNILRAYNKYIDENDPTATTEELEDAIEDSFDKLLEDSRKMKNGGKE